MTSQEAMSGRDNDYGGKAHFVLVPLMAQGHLIPATDLALLLAARGALASVVATPFGASRIAPTIEHAKKSGLQVRLVVLPLPCAEAGLPDETDNMEDVPPELMSRYFHAAALLCGPLERYLRAHPPYPTCIISDSCHPWAVELAAALKVPRLTFFSMCCFCLLCIHNVVKHNTYDGVANDNESVVVPGLPQRIEVTRAQAPPGWFARPGWEKFNEDYLHAQLVADGVVTNTFRELEPDYIDGYQEAMGKKVWTVGPLSLYHKCTAQMSVRGSKATIDADECMSWLDRMQTGSVVFVSFGSMAIVGPAQLMEIGLGLEASEKPFVWVIKNMDMYDQSAVPEFLHEFEKRVGARGLIIKGWAPQLMILLHAAIGGFVTHCGWNSTLEAVTAGVPLVTWPFFSDQFLNEKMAVEVLRIGVPIGVKEPLMYQMEKKEVLIEKGEVENAVRSLMDGEEGEARRKRARALAKKAREAMQEGGSSHADLLDLIQTFAPDGERDM